MWIPHNLLGPLKAESPKEAIQASEAATDERMFVAGFLLGNALTRAWETDLLVAPHQARREIMLDGRACVVDCSANVSGKLHEIVYSVPAGSAADALAKTFRHVSGELDRLSLQYGRSFEIAGWRIADVVHEARWRCVPFRPSSLLAEPAPDVLPADYHEVMRLYREARSATSTTWRLIAAGAILDAVVSRRAPFDREGIDLAAHVITTDMLVRSGTFVTHAALKGGTARDLYEIVEPKRQAMLARIATLGGESGEDASARAYPEAAALAALANLVDLVARDLVMASLREAGHWPVPEPAADAEAVDA